MKSPIQKLAIVLVQTVTGHIIVVFIFVLYLENMLFLNNGVYFQKNTKKA